MKNKLSLDALTVETFSTEPVAELSTAFVSRPTRYYTDCGSCGIACTSIEC
jgi:hypothetical protein